MPAVLVAAVESLKPNLVVPSGSEVTVEMITHHAGDDPDKMIKVLPLLSATYTTSNYCLPDDT